MNVNEEDLMESTLKRDHSKKEVMFKKGHLIYKG